MDIISRLSHSWLDHVPRIILSYLNDQDQINFGAVCPAWWRILKRECRLDWTKDRCRRKLDSCDAFDHYQKLVQMTREPFRAEPSVWERELVWDRAVQFAGDSLIVGVDRGVIHVWNLWSRELHKLMDIPLEIGSICACDGQRRILVTARNKFNGYYIIDISQESIVDQIDAGPLPYQYYYFIPNVVVFACAYYVEDISDDINVISMKLRWLDTNSETQYEIVFGRGHDLTRMDVKDDHLICLITDLSKERKWIELRPLKCLHQVAHRFELDKYFPIIGCHYSLIDKPRDLFDGNNLVELNWVLPSVKGMNLYKIRRYGEYVLTVTSKKSPRQEARFETFKVTVYRTDVSPPTELYTYQRDHEFGSLEVDFDQFHITIWCNSWNGDRTLILLDFLADASTGSRKRCLSDEEGKRDAKRQCNTVPPQQK